MQTQAHDAVNAATQRFHSGILCEYLQGKSSYFFQEPRVDNTFRARVCLIISRKWTRYSSCSFTCNRLSGTGPGSIERKIFLKMYLACIMQTQTPSRPRGLTTDKFSQNRQIAWNTTFSMGLGQSDCQSASEPRMAVDVIHAAFTVELGPLRLHRNCYE